MKEIQDLEDRWDKSQMGSEARYREDAAEAGLPFPPETTNSADEEEEELFEVEDLEFCRHSAEKGTDIERAAANNGMDCRAGSGAGDDEESDNVNDWDLGEKDDQHDEDNEVREADDEAESSSSDSSAINAPKSRPISTKFSIYTRADNSSLNTAKFQQGKPEPERLKFYLTNTLKEKNGPWQFPRRKDPNVVNWESKEFIARVNKWFRQILTRTINKGDGVPTANNNTWTKFEMDVLEHILPKYIARHQKIIMTPGDWRAVTKKFNKAIYNVRVPVGAPLATSGPGPNGNRTVPRERVLRKRSPHGLQTHIMISWKHSLGLTIRSLLAAPREPVDGDEPDMDGSSEDDSDEDEDSFSSSEEDDAPPKKKLKAAIPAGLGRQTWAKPPRLSKD